MIGRTVQQYEILEKLGDGGMGVVYKARDTRLDRFVALKFLPRELSLDDEANKRFMNEARTASALDHTNICTVFDVGESDVSQLFIAMRYYEGATLKDMLRDAEDGRIPVLEAVDIAIQITEGLRCAHESNIIHRDIKPDNIMVTGRNEVKILDFGLAKLSDVHVTRAGSLLGTAAYMSPEQAQGERADHRSDLWSVGLVLYEMLTGRHPFMADFQLAMVYAIVNTAPKPLSILRPDLPDDLTRIVHKALAKHPGERYQHADDLLVDLRAVARKLSHDEITTQEALAEAASTNLEAMLDDLNVLMDSHEEDGLSPAQAGPTRILVVDDEPELELLIRRKFRSKVRGGEWSFEFAPNGVEALKVLEGQPDIELILTDLNMPHMGGLTLLRRLADRKQVSKTVVISAYGDMENIRAAMNLGAFDFVTKPIDFEDLETTILKTEHELQELKDAAVARREIISLQTQWQVARRLQESIQPQTFRDRPDVEIQTFSAPAREVSGDFYDYFPLGDGKIALTVGNASGRGITAALITIMVRTAVRALAAGDPAPSILLTRLKELLPLHHFPDLSVALFFGILETNSGVLHYANAGMEPPLLAGNPAMVERLGDDGSPCIALDRDEHFPSDSATINTGQYLLIHSKGLVRMLEADRERARSRIIESVRNNVGRPPAQMVRDLVREVAQSHSMGTRVDDVTLLAIRYKGNRD